MKGVASTGYQALDVSHEPRVRGEVYGALKEELAYFTRRVMDRRGRAQGTASPQGYPADVVTADDGVETLRVALAIIASAEQERDVILMEP